MVSIPAAAILVAALVILVAIIVAMIVLFLMVFGAKRRHPTPPTPQP